MANIVRNVQSRLKSRKVLGVGENADGDIPRSKISQLLGNNDVEPWSLSRDHYPTGLWVFQWMTCVYFVVVGATVLWTPGQFFLVASSAGAVDKLATDDLFHRMKIDGIGTQSTPLDIEQKYHDLERLGNIIVFPVRMYGGAVLSLALLFVLCTVINRSNRRAVRISLVVEAAYFICEIGVSITTVYPLHGAHTTLDRKFVLTNVVRAVIVLLCAFYHAKTTPIRDSPRKKAE